MLSGLRRRRIGKRRRRCLIIRSRLELSSKCKRLRERRKLQKLMQRGRKGFRTRRKLKKKNSNVRNPRIRISSRRIFVDRVSMSRK